MTDLKVQLLDPTRPMGWATINGRRVAIYPDVALVRSFNNLTRRTGGTTTDLISDAAVIAAEASANASAANAGATIPVTGGAVSLSPANPLSKTNLSSETARIDVAQHTRTGAGAPILAGSVASVTKGFTYIVFYNDPGNAGGAVTFEATTTLSDINEGGGDRIIGTIAVPEQPSRPEGGGGGGVQP